jgi:hypothetical protein
VAKYAGFILVPFLAIRILHGTDRKLGTLVRLAVACVVVVGLAFVPGILVNGGLLGGLKSSLVTGPELSPWSIWGLLGRAESKGLSRAWLILWGAWYALLLWRFAQSPSRISDPLSLTRALASALAMLIALDPVANPQFLIWVMPLALLLAFADQSSLRLALMVVIGLLNLVTLSALLDPRVWFLDAIPNVNVAARLLPSTYHPDVARLTGVAYAIALMAMAATDAIRLGPGRRGEHVNSTTWHWAERLAIGQGIGVAIVLALVVFQPALMNRYRDAPSYPVNLDLLNSFPADHAEWIGSTLRADWSDQVRTFAQGHLDSASVEVVAQSEYHPVVSMTTAVRGVSIGQAGVAEHVVLPHSGRLLRIELLLGNPSFAVQATPLPVIRLSQGSDPSRDVGVSVSLERAIARDWFAVRVEPTDHFVGRAFTVEVSAPDGSGWAWNGAGLGEGVAGISVLGLESGVGDRWIQAWAIPRDATSKDEHIRLTADNHLEQVQRLRDSTSLTSVSFDVSRLVSRSRPLVWLKLDIRQHTALPAPQQAGIGAASIAYLTLFSVLTVTLTRLRARRTESQEIMSADMEEASWLR